MLIYTILVVYVIVAILLAVSLIGYEIFTRQASSEILDNFRKSRAATRELMRSSPSKARRDAVWAILNKTAFPLSAYTNHIRYDEITEAMLGFREFLRNSRSLRKSR